MASSGTCTTWRLKFARILITDDAGQRTWAALFARLLPRAYQQLTSLQVAK